MCELLVCIKNVQHPDPIVEAADCYKRGDIINVKEDGAPWAKKSLKSNWIAAGNDPADWHNRTAVIKIPGVPVAKAVVLMVDDTVGEIKRARRLWNLFIEDVPAVVRNKILADGEITITKTQIRNYIKNKIDLTVFTGMDD